MARGRSTQTISMIKWIQTRRLSLKISLSLWGSWSGRHGLAVGFRVEGLGCEVEGLGFRVYGVGFRVEDTGFRVWSSGFRVQGAGCRVCGVVLGVVRLAQGICMKCVSI